MSGSHNWRHRFQGHVSRWTVPREVILNLLSRTSKHLSAKEIYSSLYKSHPGIGMTTVYRTLDLLASMGLVTKLVLGDGQSRYELKSSEKEEHHHHLLCTRCGKIIDYSEFSGVDMDEIVRIAIGVGDTSPALNGKGLIYIDNISFGHTLEATDD